MSKPYLIPPPEFSDKPIPAPHRNVKQMVQKYEDNIIPPPPQSRDRPIAAPRKNVKQMVHRRI